MNLTDFKPKHFLQTTRVIYFSLWGGIIFFLIMTFYIIENKFIFNTAKSDPLMISTFIIACIFIPAGYLFANRIFSKMDQNDLLKDKLPKYQTGQIIRMATCEGVCLLSIVSLLLTSNLFFLIFLFIAFVIMIRYYPTPDKIGREINLTQNEIDMLNN